MGSIGHTHLIYRVYQFISYLGGYALPLIVFIGQPDLTLGCDLSSEG
jgi:hypothetical protein